MGPVRSNGRKDSVRPYFKKSEPLLFSRVTTRMRKRAACRAPRRSATATRQLVGCGLLLHGGALLSWALYPVLESTKGYTAFALFLHSLRLPRGQKLHPEEAIKGPAVLPGPGSAAV